MGFCISNSIACVLLLPTVVVVFTKKVPSDTPEEDMFINHFGDYPHHYTCWWLIHSWYYELGEKKLKRFCALAHEQAGYGNASVDTLFFIPRKLLFKNTNYSAKNVDVLMYGIEEPRDPEGRRRYWYMADGTRKDCVFYLDLVDSYSKRFRLKRHVCGIKMK